MTVTVESPETPYAPSGVSVGPYATVFSYDLPAEVLVVIETDGVEAAPLTLDTHYSLASTPRAAGGYTGQVTLLTGVAPSAGWQVGAARRLILRRATVADQGSPYGQVDGFRPVAAERSWDKAARLGQEHRAKFSRALLFPVGEVGFNLPFAANRPGNGLFFDENDVPYWGSPSGDPASAYMRTVLSKTTAQLARQQLGADLAENVFSTPAGGGAVARSLADQMRPGPLNYGPGNAASFAAAQAANPAITASAFTYDMNAPFVVAAGKTLVLEAGAVIAGASRFQTDLAGGGSVEMHTGGSLNQTRSSIKRHTGTLTPSQGAFWSWDAGWERFMVSDDRDVGAGFNNHTWDRSQFGGAAMKGGRHARLMAAYWTAASHPDNNNRNYVADGAFFYVQAGDNGTGVTVGTARGAYFPRSDALFVEASAQNLLHVTSVEANLFIAAGATMAYSAGRTVALNCQTRGALIDCFHLITGQSANGAYTGHIGSDAGYVQSNSSGADPFHAGSKVFTQYWTGGGTKPVATVFDVSGYAATKVIEGRQLTLTEGLLALDAGAAGAEVRAASAGANGMMIIRSKGASAIQVRSEADAVIASFSPNSTANVNFVQFFPNFTNIGPIIRATGGDTNVNLRLETKGAGVVEAIAPLRLPSFTVGGVPSASVSGAGAEIYVTDESGGAVTAFSDGANWRRVTDRAIIS